MIEPSKLSVAPMMAATHYWGRRFLRLFNPDVKIYGEMVPAKSLIFMGDEKKRAQHLRTGIEEGAVAFQLGASTVDEALRAGALVARAGFTEINLNCGCPSKAVLSGEFGASLMKKPDVVSAMLRALSDEFPDMLLSVKCRIGVDDAEDEEFLYRFIDTIISAAPRVRLFHIHARKALLKGLNPRQNRHVPPLNYQRVYDAKKKFSALEIVLNGGVQTIADIETHLPHCDGVMIGRAAVANPFLLRAASMETMGAAEGKQEFFEKKLQPFLQEFDDAGVPTSSMLPFLMNMIRDEVGARARRAALGQMVEQGRRKRKQVALLHAWQAVFSEQQMAV
ncbi:MAG: tRNA dihydrouridine(20/20a) synthase DusA [Hydrotalea sp.]|nr:tRNA dihydrouridine(20/20a) synthase DusA [Hydrotalea sp.]